MPFKNCPYCGLVEVPSNNVGLGPHIRKMHPQRAEIMEKRQSSKFTERKAEGLDCLRVLPCGRKFDANCDSFSVLGSHVAQCDICSKPYQVSEPARGHEEQVVGDSIRTTVPPQRPTLLRQLAHVEEENNERNLGSSVFDADFWAQQLAECL